jgi:hypothetical protein
MLSCSLHFSNTVQVLLLPAFDLVELFDLFFQMILELFCPLFRYGLTFPQCFYMSL